MVHSSSSAGPGPPAIEFRGVRKGYAPGRPVLEDFSLSVAAGETVALLGPSGCGKTTALKLVNRLLEPDGGDVLVFGRDVRGEDAIGLRRRTGWVIQETGLFPHWTVRENVETVPRLLGWDAARREKRVAELLAMVGLPEGEFASRPARELSGGQRQRVGVARALAADPPVVLMDEPFGALDPIARRALQREFLGWKRRLGKAVLLVTHDVREAFLLSDRVAILDGGRLRQCDTPDEIRARPADAFVREFVAEDAP
ncbi:MAG TPA: ATP-binding cassette domain-containing protein [Thermoanaerobaculia bacterium]|nr:ATP-binding cassette domain-containing protein [Thermoanaerobaculia bacterium]